MANYGDIALNLPADWSRFKQHDQNYALMTIGHAEGVSDVRLTKEPDKRHQFAWVDTRYKDEIDINRTKGYRFVTEKEWTKNEHLWEWDAEGFLLCKGQRLMARDEDRFLADMAARKKQRDSVMRTNKDEDEAQELAARAGIRISAEDDGRPVRRGLRNG